MIKTQQTKRNKINLQIVILIFSIDKQHFLNDWICIHNSAVKSSHWFFIIWRRKKMNTHWCTFLFDFIFIYVIWAFQLFKTGLCICSIYYIHWECLIDKRKSYVTMLKCEFFFIWWPHYTHTHTQFLWRWILAKMD